MARRSGLQGYIVWLCEIVCTGILLRCLYSYFFEVDRGSKSFTWRVVVPLLLFAILQIPIINSALGRHPLAPPKLLARHARQVLRRVLGIVIGTFVALSLMAHVATAVFRRDVIAYLQGRSNDIGGALIAEHMPVILNIWGRSWAACGSVVAGALLFAYYRRNQADTHDNQLLVEACRRNALLSAAMSNSTADALDASAQSVRENIGSLLRLSPRRLPLEVTAIFFPPVLTVNVLLPRDDDFSIVFSESTDGELTQVLRTTVRRSHFPKKLKVNLLEQHAREAAKQPSQSAFEINFEKKLHEWLSVAGVTWFTQQVQIENFDTTFIDDAYLEHVPLELRPKARIGSYVAIPAKHCGRIVAVILLSSNHRIAFREESRKFYEKFAHILGTSLGMAQEVGALGLAFGDAVAKLGDESYLDRNGYDRARDFVKHLRRFVRSGGKYGHPDKWALDTNYGN